jgi:DNA topoisomerase I
LEEMISEEKYTRPAPRYTEASLVKKLEELGIGRPSTYAPTISTVQKRGYVIKETRDGFKRNVRNAKLKGGVISQKTESENFGAEKSKLFPTDIGTVVTDFLNEHFKQIMDYNFTAKVEKEFDDIAQGMISWTKMIDTFYKPFHKEVDITLANADRAKGEKLLGTDPNTGKPMSVRVGRFGPLVQIGDNDDEEKKYASLRPGQSIETITIEEALDLFKLPRALGEYNNQKITAAIGRFGPYVKYGSLFASVPKDRDIFELTLPEAIELIEAKLKAESEKLLRTFSEDANLEILKGKWGPYISYKKSNFKLPKDTNITEISFDEIMKIIDAQDTKGVTKGKAGVEPKAKAKAKPKAKAKAKAKSKSK